MRVLHVINGLTTGGAETVLYRLATYPPHGVEHHVVCLEGSDWYSSQLEAKQVRVTHLNCTSAASAIVAVVRLRRILRENRPDVVQAWMYRSNIVAGLAGKLARVPVVWNIRCSSVKVLKLRSRVLAYIGGFVARWFAAAVVNCSTFSRELHARLGYDAVPEAVIPNGYDPDEFRPDEQARRAIRKRLGLNADSFLLGSIGRWDPHKDYPMLFAALRLLKDRDFRPQILLVGRELDRSNPELVRLLDECGVTDLVHPIGHRLDIPNIARAIDLHVLASVSEGFPNVVAETMLSGTPNVATDVGDAKLIVGDTGWAIPAGDPAALAFSVTEAHREWSESPQRWAQRRLAARQRVVGAFSLDRMVTAYDEVWEKVVKDRRLNEPSAKTRSLCGGSALAPNVALKRPRVLHIINSLVLGGAETVLFRLVSRGRTDRHVIVSLAGPGWYTRRLQEMGFEVHHLDIRSAFDTSRAAVRLRTIIRQSKSDLVQCWMYRSNVFGGVIAKGAGKPVVWGVHCASLKALRPSSRALARVSGLLARWNPDTVIICSREAALLHNNIGYGAARCEVIFNGYDPSAFFPDASARAATRDALGASASDFLVGTISRWDRLKDIPNFLVACRMAREQGVPLRGMLVGAGLGPTNAALIDELQRSGCAAFVQPLGPSDNVSDLARAFDLHVLASRTEAFPNVVAETMLSGTPNVVTNVGDSGVMVRDAGWLVPPHDAEKLAAAIVEAYREFEEEPARWEARRAAARKQIADNFSLERMCEAYEAVWQRVVDNGKAETRGAA